jgi:hypothetical protein
LGFSALREIIWNFYVTGKIGLHADKNRELQEFRMVGGGLKSPPGFFPVNSETICKSDRFMPEETVEEVSTHLDDPALLAQSDVEKPVTLVPTRVPLSADFPP